MTLRPGAAGAPLAVLDRVDQALPAGGGDQATQADADAVMRRVEFTAPLPTEWGVSS